MGGGIGGGRDREEEGRRGRSVGRTRRDREEGAGIGWRTEEGGRGGRRTEKREEKYNGIERKEEEEKKKR